MNDRSMSGWIGFAGILMVILGGISFFEGLIALARDNYYVPTQSGSHTVSVSALRSEEGWQALKPVTTGFMVTEPMVEFSDSNLKEDLLRRMAETTSGKYYGFSGSRETAARLRETLDDVILSAQMEGAEPRTSALWDMPVLYFLLLGLVGSEWLLRRRYGLA